MEVGTLLEALEVRRGVEVLLHHVEEAVVVEGGAPGVLHHQSPRVPQDPAHLPAQTHQRRAQLRRHLVRVGAQGWGDLEVRRQIDHRHFHFCDPRSIME